MSGKILIADESYESREPLVSALKNAGYYVVEASNGVIALTLLKEHSIGLLISEVNMQGMDGITLLKMIKEDPDKKHIPVIILTGETDEDIITEGRLTGADAWMLKPFQPELLLEAVKKLFAA